MFCSAASGATYYIDKTASGGNDGTTWADAWETLAQAVTGINALIGDGEGDTVLVADGNYAGWYDTTLIYRDDWLTIDANDGACSFSSIYVKSQNITGTLLDGCESAWTAGSGDTVSQEETIKTEGSYAVKIVLAAERSAGDLLAYFNFSAVDPGAVQPVSGFSYDIRSDIIMQGITSTTIEDYYIVISEAANGADSGTRFRVYSDGQNPADIWEGCNRYLPDLDAMDAIVSIGLYANDTIPSGTIIYLDDIRYHNHGRPYIKFDGIDIYGGRTQGTTTNKGVDFLYITYAQLLNSYVVSSEPNDAGYGASGTAHRGVSLYCTRNVRIENVECEAWSVGICSDNSNDYNDVNVVIENCVSHNTNMGGNYSGINWTVNDVEMYDTNDGANFFLSDSNLTNMYFHDFQDSTGSYHGDDLQTYPNAQYRQWTDNVTISNCRHFSGTSHGNGFRDLTTYTVSNITVENCIFGNGYYSNNQYEGVQGLVFRSNTFADETYSVQIDKLCNDITVTGNMISNLSICNAGDADDYLRVNDCNNNILGYWNTSCPSLDHGADSLDYENDMDRFKAEFVNYDANSLAGFQLIADSNGIDFVPLPKATTTDYNGNARDGLADAGFAEYVRTKYLLMRKP